MRRLLIMRHAKSDQVAGLADHERPLNDRGVASAREMGSLLTRLGQVPQFALVSSAVRARTTYELAADSGGWPTDAAVTPALYNTTPEGALTVVGGAPDVDDVLLVGHEPTWSALVRRLSGGRVRMKTATVVGLDLEVDSWDRAHQASAAISFVLQAEHFTAS